MREEMFEGTLECQNLTKKYKNTEVLHGVNLKLESGKIYGLIGRNGAGKTTLLSMLSAQNPATSGSITLNGQPVWENQESLNQICFSRELNVGPANQLSSGNLKVKDYLGAGAAFFPYWDQEMADKLIQEFEINPKKKLNALSKGMLSMVTIILALASKAPITFLDEPVAGLDVFMRDKFYQLLIEEFTESQRTFVVSTHIIDEAAPVFEEVIIVKKGDILLKENTEELLERIRHISGKTEDVDALTKGLHVVSQSVIGRRKEVTVLLEQGQDVQPAQEVTINNVSLQNAFLALCGD